MRRLTMTGVSVVLLVVLMATTVLAENIRGTNGPDVLRGTEMADTIKGLKGADRVLGRDGSDEVRGNRGADEVRGGGGPDEVYGGLASDSLYGRFGDDSLFAKDGVRDFVYCGPGRDRAVVDVRDRVQGCEIINEPVINEPVSPPEDLDRDDDGVNDDADNCPDVANLDQTNTDKDFKKFVPGNPTATPVVPDSGTPGVVQDGDTLGDACDTDDDNDGALDTADPEPLNPAIDTIATS